MRKPRYRELRAPLAYLRTVVDGENKFINPCMSEDSYPLPANPPTNVPSQAKGEHAYPHSSWFAA